VTRMGVDVATLGEAGDLDADQIPVPDIEAIVAGTGAATADKLKFPRTISLAGDVAGSTAFDGSEDVSISAAIADDSHNHTLANVDGLQAALDGKLGTGAKAADSNLLDGLDSTVFVRGDGGDNGRVTVKTNNNDLIFTDTENTSLVNYLWRDHSGGKLYLGTPEDVPTTREDMVTSEGDKYWHDGNKPSISASASNGTIVQRHSSGYIYANYFNTTPNDVSSGITRVCVETHNDGFIRHGTPYAIREFIGKVNDSDKVDGLQSWQFLRSDANDSKTSGYTRYNDGISAQFGNSADLTVSHNGHHSYIQNNTSNLYIQQRLHGGTICLQAEDSAGVNRAAIYARASHQSLYGDGAERLRVDSLGCAVNSIHCLNGNTMTIGGGEMGARLANPEFTLHSERLYLGAEEGLRVVSSPDNLVSWPTRHEATICDSNGNSSFPGIVYANQFRLNGSNGFTIYRSGSSWTMFQFDVGNAYYRVNQSNYWHYFQSHNGSSQIACAHFGINQKLFYNNAEKFRTTGTGCTIYGSVTESSSRELKNILGFPENPLDKIAALNPVIYALKDDENQSPQIGLIAEDVPDDLLIAQKGGEVDERGVNYARLSVWAIAAIQELKQRLEALEGA